MSDSPESDRLARTEAIFNEVLSAEVDLRPELLERLCASDDGLRAEVQALLAAFAMESVASGNRRRQQLAAADALPLRRVGPYELQSLLGRGGMGAVYLANRADGEYEKQVAVKLIDVPLMTEVFRQRFRQERQILAGLDHPLIARLLDGGVAENGAPYLVIDYVDGIPIDRFCREKLPLMQGRLELCLQVMEAVQFAHGRLVVHRDLKPDNILVTGDGVPHLLDFGTAKLLSAETFDVESVSTREGYFSFTPQYASPEQILGQTITVASDVYSLGVLLYLLLTDELPYRLESTETAVLIATICHQDPRRPSLVVGSLGRVDTDLECILLKALRKEPAERYKSVDQFADDIRCWLENRPVAARQGNLRYRAGKFVRRRWLALGAATALVVTIGLGVTGVAIEHGRANAERVNARARSEGLRKLSKSMLSEVDDAVTKLPGSTPLQLTLLSRVVEHLDALAHDAKDDPQVQLDMVNAYTRLAHVQGDPYYQNVGDPKAAMASLDKALGFATALQGAESRDPNVLEAYANEERSRSETVFSFGKQDEAESALQAAIQAYERRLSLIRPTAGDLAEVGLAYNILGDLRFNGRQDRDPREENGSIAAYREELKLTEEAARLDPSGDRALRGQAFSHAKIASTLVTVDPYASLAEGKLALAAQDALPVSAHSTKGYQTNRAWIFREISLAQYFGGDLEGAVASIEVSRELQEPLLAADPTNTLAQYWMMDFLRFEAEIYRQMLNPELGFRRADDVKNRARAIASAKRAVEINDRLVQTSPSNFYWKASDGEARTVLGTLEQGTPHAKQGAALAAGAIAQLRESASKPDAGLITLDAAVHSTLMVEPVSLRDAGWTLDAAERLAARTKRRNNYWLLALAQAANNAGRYDEALHAMTEAYALLPAEPAGSHPLLNRRLLDVEMDRQRRGRAGQMPRP